MPLPKPPAQRAAVLSAEDVKTEDLGLVELRGKGQLVEHDKEACSWSHPSEGILIKKPRSKIVETDIGRVRYFYKFPQSVEIRALEAYERVGWVVLG